MRARFLSTVSVLALVAVWLGGLSEAQDVFTKRDAQGPVTVTVTLIPGVVSSAPIRAKVVLDTHSVVLDGVAFEQAVSIRSPDGAATLPTAVEQATGSGHHREAVLVFPAASTTGRVQIVVKDVGGVNERVFTWESVR
jgi:hypothetical protein